ncbi:hypothetical protein H3V11_04600 [Snodgrassella sp. W8158]|uniref:hypothetical protein n=1 Tax=Snodgrassella sp. W8158 TaxID=2751018 RepID=UPI0018DBDB52|nr:hypothetical protein [Snodgrassella sp. W8158]MBI0181224.1 hypothetical protein [Snodgrassella sp. W8158]
MKKILFVLLGLFIGACANAESPQVQYIKGMYDLNASLLKGGITKDSALNIYQNVDESFFFRISR